MLHREDDNWDHRGLDEDALLTRMDVLGKAPICEFGSGRQGLVYMTDDGNFVKITRSTREAALARNLVDNPKKEFPRIDEVYRFEHADTTLFAIYREGVDDIFDPFDEDARMVEAFARSWCNLVLLWPPQHNHPAVRLLADEYPDLYGELYDFLGELQDLKDFENFEICDFHWQNVGRNTVGRMVVRDLGDHTLDNDFVDTELLRIEELPMPQQVLAA